MKSRCCEKGNYSGRAWNEQLRWLLCRRSCNQKYWALSTKVACRFELVIGDVVGKGNVDIRGDSKIPDRRRVRCGKVRSVGVRYTFSQHYELAEVKSQVSALLTCLILSELGVLSRYHTVMERHKDRN